MSRIAIVVVCVEKLTTKDTCACSTFPLTNFRLYLTITLVTELIIFHCCNNGKQSATRCGRFLPPPLVQSPATLCVEVDYCGGIVIFTVHLVYRRPRKPILESAHLPCIINPTTIHGFVVAVM